VNRRRLLVNGIVQGVGFRPFVAQTAADLGLAGHVCNTSAGVVIEIEGSVPGLDEFTRRLQEEAPPLAHLVSLGSEEIPTAGAAGFEIHASVDTPGTSTLIPPDIATCADCLREVRDPSDRRCGYPFTNCTNCGPRWTIIGRIPYDRPHTSMSGFTMCPACQTEYDDLHDRRFHAQPNACADCGPHVWLDGPLGATDAEGSVLERAAEALARHAVLAIRGLGGFHLAVRADLGAPVRELRRRKHRAGKPLAVMVPDLATARRLSQPTGAEEKLLLSPTAPIVLVAKRPEARLAPEVAPGHRRVGLMLPPTPLHHLLCDALGAHGIEAVVMTSGNLGEEPICIANDEARQRLAGVADAFVLHDREILRRADDSVLQVVADQPLLLRRSRGLAPVPVFVSAAAGVPPILAVGTQLKNTVCLLQNGRAFLSPHVGDLGQLETDAFFKETIATLQDVLECAPTVLAHDLHPGYTATVWAKTQQKARPELQLIAVQHHHAHLAAVLAEHDLSGPAVGLIMDGTGFGDDGTIWGGEVLVGDATDYTRVAHFEPVPLPGGDAAIKAPWRQAVSYLRYAYGSGFFAAHPDEFPFQGDRPVGPVLEMLDRNLNAPLTSSCGRLFDAVAALVGPWSDATYEAQAAIELAALTTPGDVAKAQPFALAVDELRERLATADSEPLLLPVATVIRAVREARRAGVAPAAISAMFHRTVIEVLARVAGWAAARHGLGDVVLGGGVFQNEILLAGLEQRLRRDGLRPWRPVQVPPGDGGVSLGQAVVAAARLASNCLASDGSTPPPKGTP
jgi:hydrogenase maturation protein HypF